VWLRQADDERLTDEVLRLLRKRPELRVDDVIAARVRVLMPGLKERAKTLCELSDSAAFLARPLPLPIDAKGEALLTVENRQMLREVATALGHTDFSQPAIDAALRAFAEAHGRKLAQVAQPIRVALTGGTTSPGIDATLAALGADEALARIAAVAG
jgi:glutamyl-tRNA synthetase